MDDENRVLLSRRQSLEARNLEGEAVRFSVAIAKKLYRCPGCGGRIEVGADHVIVRYPESDPPFYQHWHRTCALGDLIRSLREVKAVAGEPALSPGTRRRKANQRRRRR